MANIFRRIQVVFDRFSAKKAEQELESSMAEGGKKAGQAFVGELRKAFARRMAELKVQLASGLIDEKQFKKQAELAAKTFNAGIVKGMEAARKAGNLTEKEFIKLSGTLKRVGDDGSLAGGRIQSAFIGAGKAIIGFFGAREIGRFIGSSIRAAEEQSAENKRLEAQLRNVGIAWRNVRGQINETTKALRVSHRLTQSEVSQTLQRLIFLTGNYQKSLENVGLVADVAAARQIDQAAAADIVGKAINGNLRALKQLGITAKDSGEALEILRTRSVGQAKASTTATQAMTKAWGEFKEEFGEAILDASNGRSIFDRLTRAIITLTNHANELVSLFVSFGKALLVGGIAAGLFRFTTAIQAATVGVSGFLAVVRSGLALLGPKGWFILGVAALTTWFERMAGAARKAGEESAKALESFKRGLEGLSEENLKAEEAAIITQRRDLERQRTGIGTGPIDLTNKAAAARAIRERQQARSQIEAQLAALAAREQVIREERERRGLTPLAPPGAAGADEKDDKKALRDRERLEHDIRVRSLQLEEQVTQDLAEEMVRRQEVLGTAAKMQFATIEEGFKRLDDLNKMLAVAGFDKTLIPQVKRTEQAIGGLLPAVNETMTAGMERVAEQSEILARLWSTPWIDAMGILENEVEGQGTLFAELGQAWAEGGFAGLAALAAAKVKENVARIIEEGAKAIGAIALGNPKAAAEHAASAAKHGLAVVAWKAAGAAAGGTTGGASSAGGSAGSTSTSSASNLERPESAINIYLTGPGWNALNPEVQKVVHQAGEYARERYGSNSQVRIIRGSR